MCIAHMNDSMLTPEAHAYCRKENAETVADTDTLEKGYSVEHRARALNSLYADQACMDSVFSSQASVYTKVALSMCMAVFMVKVCLDIYIEFSLLKSLKQLAGLVTYHNTTIGNDATQLTTLISSHRIV